MRYHSIPRSFVIATFAIFGLMAVLLVAQSFGGDGGLPPAIAIVWLVALALNAYVWLVRISADLALEADTLVASGVVLRRVVELDRITGVRPMRRTNGIAVIEVEGGRSVWTINANGFGVFAAELARRRPAVSVQLRR